MKVRCLYNTGEALRMYEKEPPKMNELGKFGATGLTEFGIVIGKEYLVMGMILGEGILTYLIDDRGYISAYPYPLFEIIQNTIPSNWFFRALSYTDAQYPYQEAIWGYHELVFDNDHYEKLIDVNEDAMRIYFKRKIEIENELE